jgi:2-iminobutanoate/2-iminopropanoate deaminase
MHLTLLDPYNQAILFDGTLYLSGQIALDPINMKMRDESIETETRQVFKNIKAVLEKENYDFKNIVKTTIFLTNMDDFQKVNEIYGSYFEIGKEPARETVEVSGLPKGAKVEISLIARK